MMLALGAALLAMQGKPLRVAVAGGGPAGLTLAHALQTLPGPCEVEVSVYEKYSELRPAVGGGIQVRRCLLSLWLVAVGGTAAFAAWLARLLLLSEIAAAATE